MGVLKFTFYNAAGYAIAPGAISTDASASFATYFAGSNLGGVFALSAAFPVTGDETQVAACDVTLTNGTGTTLAPRIVF
jgi:hypothetical protein